MYQHVKRTCNACRDIVFASCIHCFVAFSLPLSSPLLKRPIISTTQLLGDGPESETLNYLDDQRWES